MNRNKQQAHFRVGSCQVRVLSSMRLVQAALVTSVRKMPSPFGPPVR